MEYTDYGFCGVEDEVGSGGLLGETPLGFGVQSMIGLWRRDGDDDEGPDVGC